MDPEHREDSELTTWQMEEVHDDSGTPPTTDVEPLRRAQREDRRFGYTLIVTAVTTAVVVAVATLGFIYATRLGDSEDASGLSEETGEGRGESAPETQAEGPTQETEANDSQSDPAPPGLLDQSGATENRTTRPSAMSFVSVETDQQGRPLPVLPRYLVRNTVDPEDLQNYHPDPAIVPDAGPYTVVKGGFFFLRGTVDSENLRQEIVRRYLLVTSRDSLIVELQVDEGDSWYLDEPLPLFFEDPVLFEVGESELKLDALRIFLRYAELLSLSPEISLEVTGHTDSQGDPDYNLALSEMRVSVVKDAFVRIGAPADQIITSGRGETEPIATNDTDEGRSMNRRVDFAITYRS